MKKLLSLSLLAFAACKKNNEPPMGASNGGQSYLSCKINGKQYTFTGKPVGLNPTGVLYSYARWVHLGGGVYRDFSVSGEDIGRQHAQVHITLSADTSYSLPLKTRINFSEQAQKEVFVLVESLANVADGYYYAGNDGWINITRADSIGTGTFGFTAWGLDYNGNRLPDSDSIIVTEGRFDIHK